MVAIQVGEVWDLSDKLSLILFFVQLIEQSSMLFSLSWTLVCGKLIPHSNEKIQNAMGDFCD